MARQKSLKARIADAVSTPREERTPYQQALVEDAVRAANTSTTTVVSEEQRVAREGLAVLRDAKVEQVRIVPGVHGACRKVPVLILQLPNGTRMRLGVTSDEEGNDDGTFTLDVVSVS